MPVVLGKIVSHLIALTISATLVVACVSKKADIVTPSPSPIPSATPSPLYTLEEARQRVQQFAATDPSIPQFDRDAYVICGAVDLDEDRYVSGRTSWVIHCKWEAIDLRGIETAIADGRTPPPIFTLNTKTYILDDLTGNIRD